MCTHFWIKLLNWFGDHVDMLNMILYGIWEHGNSLCVKCVHGLRKKSFLCGNVVTHANWTLKAQVSNPQIVCTSSLRLFWWWIFTFLQNLSFVLLHITNDDQILSFFWCFDMVFNNSSLFMSMSNLI
jgi:hypothetical protein